MNKCVTCKQECYEHINRITSDKAYNEWCRKEKKCKCYWDHTRGYYVGWTGNSWRDFVSKEEYEEWYQDHIGD